LKEIFKESVLVNSSAEDTWYYFIQFQNSKDWMPGVSEMRVPLDSLPLKKGSIIEATIKGNKQRSTVVEYEAEKSITLRSVVGHFQADYTYQFQQEDNQARVTLVATCEAHGFVTKIIALPIRNMIKKQDAGQLEKFKTACESRTRNA